MRKFLTLFFLLLLSNLKIDAQAQNQQQIDSWATVQDSSPVSLGECNLPATLKFLTVNIIPENPKKICSRKIYMGSRRRSCMGHYNSVRNKSIL